jgi:hypothetical protein
MTAGIPLCDHGWGLLTCGGSLQSCLRQVGAAVNYARIKSLRGPAGHDTHVTVDKFLVTQRRGSAPSQPLFVTQSEVVMTHSGDVTAQRYRHVTR